MTRPLLVLRPQPGADATAARVRGLGLEAVVTPLFAIEDRDWSLPADLPEALLVTSANAAMRAEPPHLLAYAVGEATAAVLRERRFDDVVTGASGIQALVDRAAADGRRSLLHLAGEDRTEFDPRGLLIETRIVYASVGIEPDPAFEGALEAGAVAMLHSSSAARRFRGLAGKGHRIAALSPAVADAAGSGWAAMAVADAPTDTALLAAAARLCH